MGAEVGCPLAPVELTDEGMIVVAVLDVAEQSAVVRSLSTRMILLLKSSHLSRTCMCTFPRPELLNTVQADTDFDISRMALSFRFEHCQHQIKLVGIGFHQHHKLSIRIVRRCTLHVE